MATGENKDFLLTAFANESGSFDIEGRMEWYFGDDPETTHDGDVETLRLDVFEPKLPPAPTLTPSPTPTPEPTLPPHVGQPTVNLHATQTEASLGEPVTLRLSVVNSIAKPEMTLKLILQVPSGWSMSGSGFSESCTGQCTASYVVDSGDQRSVELEMQPNQAGSFTVEAQMEWWFGEDTSTLDGKAVSLPLNVIPLATPVPTALPRAAQPAFSPPSNGDGSLSTPGSGSLVLLGLLILPVVGLIARPLLARPDVPSAARAGLAPLDWVARTVLTIPGSLGNHSPGRRRVLVILVMEALGLTALALLLHVLWADHPERSNLTVMVWPISSLIVLLTASLLSRNNMPVLTLGVPLMFWMALLMFLHFTNFLKDDASLFYPADVWASLIMILPFLGIAGLFALRNKTMGRRGD